jgi:hypothetical protein
MEQVNTRCGKREKSLMTNISRVVAYYTTLNLKFVRQSEKSQTLFVTIKNSQPNIKTRKTTYGAAMLIT